MGATENAGFNAEIQWNFGLDFVQKTAQITAKTSTSLQLSITDMLTHVNFPTVTTVDPRYTLLLLLHPFNGLFSRTTWVSWYQRDKPVWI